MTLCTLLNSKTLRGKILFKGSAHSLTLYAPVTKSSEFTNNTDPDEVAHYEPPHLRICTVCHLVFEFSI